MTLEEIAEEIRLTMSLTTTKNAVKVYDFYVTQRHVYVVMELLRGGELLEALVECSEYSEADTATIMQQLFTGLESMHAQSVTHRDLKLENLILAVKDDITSIRIADFGLAKKMKTARAKLVEQCGTPPYVAPEVITGQQYTPAVDMWAAGVIMYTLLCGAFPFDQGGDRQASFRLIAKGHYHRPTVRMSAYAQSLLDKLLCVNKAKRFTASEALEHKWIVGNLGGSLGYGGGGAGAGAGAGGFETAPARISRMTRAAESKLGSDLQAGQPEGAAPHHTTPPLRFQRHT